MKKRFVVESCYSDTSYGPSYYLIRSPVNIVTGLFFSKSAAVKCCRALNKDLKNKTKDE